MPDRRFGVPHVPAFRQPVPFQRHFMKCCSRMSTTDLFPDAEGGFTVWPGETEGIGFLAPSHDGCPRFSFNSPIPTAPRPPCRRSGNRARGGFFPLGFAGTPPQGSFREPEPESRNRTAGLVRPILETEPHGLREPAGAAGRLRLMPIFRALPQVKVRPPSPRESPSPSFLIFIRQPSLLFFFCKGHDLRARQHRVHRPLSRISPSSLSRR